MDFEKQNKLPEGVGKKIIEALKTNKDRVLEDVHEFEAQTQNSYLGNPTYNSYQEPEYKEPSYNNYNFNNQNHSYPREEYNNRIDYREQKVNNRESVGVSSIDTLVDLVSKLPPGVTKQTGAQIIRHTMEAMGIPMNQVLTKAQVVQEELEQGIKNNANIIEEHKAKIKVLDQEIQMFRKKAQDLEDIINLFILSEHKK